MSSSQLPPYVVQELPDISDLINEPLKSAQRIKYTCLDVSKSFIALGATSGGIYIFNRRPCEFVQLIPSKDGAITRLSISPDEKHISFANGGGIVTVTECKQSLAGHKYTTSSKEHQGNEVTTLIWGRNLLFIGDDVGGVSVLQVAGFLTKTLFQSSQSIMSLDSRICQMDLRDSMLLVSTLTRCYICDTAKEQYRQVGQKLRDGEFGACFVISSSNENGSVMNTDANILELKKYNIVDGDQTFVVHEKYSNTLIYCARPSSRLWEATIDGTVQRTHQYKQVLAKSSYQIITNDAYKRGDVNLEIPNQESDGKSCVFPKIFRMNGAIFSFRKDALYFLNTENVEHTLWFNMYTDILDCKLYQDTIYLWRQNGSLVTLKYMTIEKYLIKCFLDAKFVVCAELCALFSSYLLSDRCTSNNMSILVGLREKLGDHEDLIQRINYILEHFEKFKGKEATQMKSGIFVVDNTYQAQAIFNDDLCISSEDSKRSSPDSSQISKDVTSAMTDKVNHSKNNLADLEGKFKGINVNKDTDLDEISHDILFKTDDIIYKESNQKVIDVKDDGVCKLLFQQYRLSVTSKAIDRSSLVATLEKMASDIKQVHELMLLLEGYCKSINAIEESKHAPTSIFLTYINESKNRSEVLQMVIDDEQLYKYFVDSCISVNVKYQNMFNMGCQCGFPLPYMYTNKTPEYANLIDEFIEKQWSSIAKEQCYEICKKMPYLWRKILYLRRNEDLMNILRLLLQILDENLLHTFLPQFTLDTWERAIQLYATLHGNICLNCGNKFEDIQARDTMCWDGLGALIIKSVGGRNAARVVEKFAHLIAPGDMTIKFYHASLLAALFEKIDSTVIAQLTDTIYEACEFEDARMAVCNLLKSTSSGNLKNTSLPIIVAAKSSHWGLVPLGDETARTLTEDAFLNDTSDCRVKVRDASLEEVINSLTHVHRGVSDCTLCGLPLANKVLINDGGLWVFKCGHTFHGACLDINKLKLCPSCVVN